MIDIEKLKAEQAKALAEAEERNAIAATMPVPPKSVMVFNWKNSCPWVSYEVDTLKQAVELADTFKWVPYAYAKKGCAVVRPEALLGEYADYVALEFEGVPILKLATVNCNIFNSELEFFTVVADRLLCIHIGIKQHPDRISVSKRYPHAGGHSYDYVKTYPRLHEDKQIVWAASEDSASASYLWGNEESYRAALRDILGE